jgi:hypothetical protein
VAVYLFSKRAISSETDCMVILVSSGVRTPAIMCQERKKNLTCFGRIDLPSNYRFLLREE